MAYSKNANVIFCDDILAPVKIEKNGNIAHVYIQQRWEIGEFKDFIQKNGCGHCCIAIALALNGLSDITPYDEYMNCRRIWGKPKTEAPYNQWHFLSTKGVYKSVISYGVSAEYINIPFGGETVAADKIYKALEAGKTVIFWSHPNKSDNPFSTGDHYVLAVGITEDGSVLIANSSTNAKTDTLGVQAVTKQTIADALWGNDIHPDITWGEIGNSQQASGFVIIG